MKLSQAIKELQKLKKECGDVELLVLNGVTARHNKVKSFSKIYPLNDQMLYDLNKPVYGIEAVDY